jgi:hypothetical protein
VMRIETQGLKNKVAKTQGLKRCLSLNIIQNLKRLGEAESDFFIFLY